MFGRVETGQVFVLFDNVHLFTGPEEKKTWKNNLKAYNAVDLTLDLLDVIRMFIYATHTLMYCYTHFTQQFNILRFKVKHLRNYAMSKCSFSLMTD